MQCGHFQVKIILIFLVDLFIILYTNKTKAKVHGAFHLVARLLLELFLFYFTSVYFRVKWEADICQLM